MRLINITKHNLDAKWLQAVLDFIGVNPIIQIEYADNPKKVKTPNYKAKLGKRYEILDGLAEDNNRVYIFVGNWQSGVFEDFKLEHIQWLLLHELRHQYYFYHIGNSGDPWKGLPVSERIKREEKACDRFANKYIGCTTEDFLDLIAKNVKTKSKSTRLVKGGR